MLPVPRTRAALEVIVAHVCEAQAALPVPLALENIATLIEWPECEFDEATFLCGILERTDALLLLDIENVYANARNHGGDPLALLDRLPLGFAEIANLHQGIDKKSQSEFRRQPASRCVRGIDQTELFQIRHHVADRGRRQRNRDQARNVARTNRFAGGQIALDDLPEDLARPLIELGKPGMR